MSNIKKAIRKKMKKRDVVDDIISYETGELGEDATIKMFQKLVDSGQAWRLQGHYGRTASALLEQGIIKPPRKKTKQNSYDYYGNRIW